MYLRLSKTFDKNCPTPTSAKHRNHDLLILTWHTYAAPAHHSLRVQPSRAPPPESISMTPPTDLRRWRSHEQDIHPRGRFTPARPAVRVWSPRLILDLLDSLKAVGAVEIKVDFGMAADEYSTDIYAHGWSSAHIAVWVMGWGRP